MKKIIMTMAAAAMFICATQSLTAQENTVSVKSEMNSMQEQKDYQLIEVKDLPEAVSEAIATDFEGATVSEAFVDEKQETYKISLQVQGKDAQTVYANADGEWLKPQE